MFNIILEIILYSLMICATWQILKFFVFLNKSHEQIKKENKLLLEKVEQLLKGRICPKEEDDLNV